MVPRWCDYYCSMHLWCIVSWILGAFLAKFGSKGPARHHLHNVVTTKRCLLVVTTWWEWNLWPMPPKKWKKIDLLGAPYDVIHLWCAESLVRCFFVVLHLWCSANFVNYIFIAIFLWWTTSSCVSWYWVQYIFGVASLVLCIVSYIAQACYRSGASTLYFITLNHFRVTIQ